MAARRLVTMGMVIMAGIAVGRNEQPPAIDE
jgi:hypothetical protein